MTTRTDEWNEEAFQQWLSPLKEKIEIRFAENPPGPVDGLSDREQMMAELHQSSFAKFFLQDMKFQRMQLKALHPERQDWNQETIVSTDEVGLSVLKRAYPTLPPGLTYCLEQDLREHLSENPDEEHRFHFWMYSLFKKPSPKQILPVRAKLRMGEGEEVWCHSFGYYFGRLHGQGSDHIWSYHPQKAGDERLCHHEDLERDWVS